VCLIGDVSTGWINTAGRLFSAALSGESMRAGAGVLLYLILKMSANYVSAVILSSPTIEWNIRMWMFEGICHIIGCHKESVCGEELWHWRVVWGKKPKVSTMSLLVVGVIYTF
jgi:hypothetical protein